MFKPSTTTTTTTTTTISSPMHSQFIFDYRSSCREVFGRLMPSSIEKQAIYYADLLGEQTVIEAILETALAPRPSWRYTLAILSNCHRDGVRSYEDYQLRQQRFNDGW